MRTADVAVANVDPAPTLQLSGPPITGTPITYTVAINDPGSLDTHSIVWNFGGTIVQGGLQQTFTMQSPGVVRVTVTDDDGGAGFATTDVSIPLLAEGDTADGERAIVSSTLVDGIAAAARSYWITVGADASLLDGVTVEIADLDANMLGSTFVVADGHARIRLDYDAAGFGWFADETPLDAIEFSMIGISGGRLASTGPAAGRMDLLTALVHEYGHAIGLGHADDAASGSVMLSTLASGLRRLPTASDLLLVDHAADLDDHDLVATGILNGTFVIANPADSGYGWNASGGAGVVGGQGVLAEDERFLAGLSQSFLLPSGAQRLVFTLVDADLVANTSGPADAFELALLDVGGASLAGVAPISLTDALLNIQTDGSVYAANGVTIRGWDPQTKLTFDRSWVIEIDVRAIAAGTEATLYFDLIGFGELTSRITIDDVRIEVDGVMNTAPTARDDAVGVDEDGSVSFEVRGNDVDGENDALAVQVVSSAQHGGLVQHADGTFTYTPTANYFGVDSFTYRVNDGALDSNVATVSITVNGVNDAPVFVSSPVVSVVADAQPSAPQDRAFRAGDTGDVTLELVSGDKTKIEAGLYRVDDASGRIGSLRPGDAGYLEAALAAGRALVGVNSRDPAGTTRALGLAEGELYGAYLIVSPKRIATPGGAPVGPAPYGANVYFSFEGANPEAYDHLRASVVGDALELRWENGLHTLDRDYDDLVLRVSGLDLGGKAQYVYEAQASDIDGGTLTYTLLEAPQGAAIDAATGRITLSTGTGSYDFVVAVNDGRGGEAEQAFTLTVSEPGTTNAPVKVEALAATPSGFRVRFDRAIDTTTVGTADVRLQNAQGQAIPGAIVFDADQAGLTFIAEGAALTAGTYTVQLKSGALSIPQLDGDADGTAGDDYAGTITIAANTALGRVSIGDVDAAPGESIARLPVQLISAGQVNAVRFTLIYDPSLLVIEGASLAAGLPSGVFLSTNFATPGYARFVLSAPKALPGGLLNLIDIRASVPAGAPLGAKQVLDVAEVFVNGSVAGSDDDGVHRAGEVPVQIPIGAQVQSSTPAGEPQAASTSSQPAAPSKLAKLLTKLKETLTGSAAKSVAVSLEASEAPKLPLLAVVSPNDAVRTPDTAPIRIDVSTPIERTSLASVGVRSAAPVSGEVSTDDWRSEFVLQPALSTRTALKVVVPHRAG